MMMAENCRMCALKGEIDVKKRRCDFFDLFFTKTFFDGNKADKR